MSEPQPPLLLKEVSQCTSNLYCNTPPICIAVLSVPLHSEEREILSVLHPFVSPYASHLYCNAPPIRIAALLRNLGGCGHQNDEHVQQCQILPQKAGILLAHTLDFACKRQACRQCAKDAEHCNKLEAQICWDSHKWLICENGKAWGPRFRVQILHHNLGHGVNFIRGKFFYLQLELFCLQLSCFAYSSPRCLSDTLSHCKWKSSIESKKLKL